MWLDRESQIDLLAYEPFAELITNIVANKRLNPLTIGLLVDGVQENLPY